MSDAQIHHFPARLRLVSTNDRASKIAHLRAQADRQRDIARNATERADECRLTLTDFWQDTAAKAYRRAELATEAATALEQRIAALLGGNDGDAA